MNQRLFDDDINDKGDPQEWFINQKDAASFAGRVSRLKYLHKLNPEGKALMGNIETLTAYREMQWCFIEGFYLSVIVLAQSLIEKILQDALHHTPGVGKKDTRTLTAMLEFIKKQNLLHNFWIEKIDRIRILRNPITHLRYFSKRDRIDPTSYLENESSIENQLENDAKCALEVATHFSLCRLNQLF